MVLYNIKYSIIKYSIIINNIKYSIINNIKYSIINNINITYVIYFYIIIIFKLSFNKFMAD